MREGVCHALRRGGGVQVGAGRETEYNSDGVEAGGQEAAGGLGGWGQWIGICSFFFYISFSVFFPEAGGSGLRHAL